MFKITCAKCAKRLEAPDEAAGKKGKCPECEEIFDIPEIMPLDKTKPETPGPLQQIDGPEKNVEAKPQTPTPQGQKFESEKQAGAIKLTCSNCGKGLELPAETAGKETACPYCKTILNVLDESEKVGKDIKNYTREIRERLQDD